MLPDESGTLTDWVVLCGTNGGAHPGNIILDQAEIGISSGGEGNVQLNINYDSLGASDWVLHSVLIWNSTLSTATMKAVTAALRKILTSCEAGYTWGSVEVACTACDAGTFKTSTGVGKCSACPVGTFLTSTGGISLSACTSCPAGSYSETEGSAECSACPAGSYSEVVGATSSETCTGCSVGSYGRGIELECLHIVCCWKLLGGFCVYRGCWLPQTPPPKPLCPDTEP
ncbi:hypothetical protein T484DRAFT_1662522 [Baffinella frigidus]|nr:hypothetical protein T484DRAFT_1662522 [Cryptophyta sp. CCMP2293]